MVEGRLLQIKFSAAAEPVVLQIVVASSLKMKGTCRFDLRSLKRKLKETNSRADS